MNKSKFLLIVVFFIFALFNTTIFASYIPSDSDKKLSELIINKVDDIIETKPSNKDIFIKVLPSLIQKYNKQQRYSIGYVFEQLLNHLKNTTNSNITNQNTNDIFSKLYNSKSNICDQGLGELTKNISKQTIIVSSETEIRNALSKSKTTDSFVEIVIKKGIYKLSNGFWIDGGNVIIRGETGNPSDVVLLGKGMQGGISHIFWLVSSDIYIGDMTIGEVANHPIQIHGEKNADNIIIHNLIIKDAGEQMLKGSYDKKNKPNISTDNAIVQCSEFYYTAGIGPQYYIGGIDVHHGQNWLIQYNTFKGIRSPENRLAEHAIHFWSESQNIIIKENRIENCDRGIGLGLGDSGFSSGKILSNIILHDQTRGDVGIGLENAHDVYIYGNTINFENTYPNAIEYRFPGSYNIIIEDNDVNKLIKSRDGGSAIVR